MRVLLESESGFVSGESHQFRQDVGSPLKVDAAELVACHKSDLRSDALPQNKYVVIGSALKRLPFVSDRPLRNV